MQLDEKALIFDANFHNDGYYGVFAFEYLIGNTPHKMEIILEHPLSNVQSAGQRAYSLLVRACGFGFSSPEDASDFLEKEVSLRALDDIDAIISGDPTGTPTGTKDRYVYVISCTDAPQPLCKIGIAQSPERRLRTLATASPHSLRLELARYFNNARAIESAAHQHFRKYRANGEWFNIDPSAVSEFLNSQAAA